MIRRHRLLCAAFAAGTASPLAVVAAAPSYADRPGPRMPVTTPSTVDLRRRSGLSLPGHHRHGAWSRVKPIP